MNRTHSASNDTSGTHQACSTEEAWWGKKSAKEWKRHQKDGASLPSCIYSSVCLFLSDFYYIFKWSHWGLNFKKSIKSKQVDQRLRLTLHLTSSSSSSSSCQAFEGAGFGFHSHFSSSSLTVFNSLELQNEIRTYLKGSSPPGLTEHLMCFKTPDVTLKRVFVSSFLSASQAGWKKNLTVHVDVWG